MAELPRARREPGTRGPAPPPVRSGPVAVVGARSALAMVNSPAPTSGSGGPAGRPAPRRRRPGVGALRASGASGVPPPVGCSVRRDVIGGSAPAARSSAPSARGSSPEAPAAASEDSPPGVIALARARRRRGARGVAGVGVEASAAGVCAALATASPATSGADRSAAVAPARARARRRVGGVIGCPGSLPPIPGCPAKLPGSAAGRSDRWSLAVAGAPGALARGPESVVTGPAAESDSGADAGPVAGADAESEAGLAVRPRRARGARGLTGSPVTPSAGGGAEGGSSGGA